MPNSSKQHYKIPMFRGKPTSQNTAQAIALAAQAASPAAVQGTAAHSTYAASVPRVRILDPTNRF